MTHLFWISYNKSGSVFISVAGQVKNKPHLEQPTRKQRKFQIMRVFSFLGKLVTLAKP